MAELTCREAELIGADAEMGRASDAARIRRETHLQRCAVCARRAQRLGMLVHALRAESEQSDADRRSDRAVISRAMMQAGQTAAKPQGRASGWWIAAAAALLLAVASAGGTLYLRDGAGHSRRSHVQQVEGAGAQSGPHERPTPTGKAPPENLAAGESSPCHGVAASAGPRTRFYTLPNDDGGCQLAVDRGEVRFDVDPEADARVSVRTPSITVRVVGTVFLVRVADGGETSVVVARGRVEVEDRESRRQLDAGQQAQARPGREVVVRSASPATLARLGNDDTTARADTTEQATASRKRGDGSRSADVAELRRMLRRGRSAQARAQAREHSRQPIDAQRRSQLLTVVAESYAVEGRYSRAFDAYRQVWESSPGTPPAGNALLSAADMALDRLDRPAQAHRLYGEYLRSHAGGPLVDVARLGRCRALRKMGRRGDATRCARAYLDDHPQGALRDQAEGLVD